MALSTLLVLASTGLARADTELIARALQPLLAVSRLDGAGVASNA